MKRPDYFNLSVFARTCARGVTKTLSVDGDVYKEAVEALRHGFVVPDPAALDRAGCVFAELSGRPGGGSALSNDKLQDRALLICEVSANLRGLEEWIDLQWSVTWATFMSSRAKAAVSGFHGFAASYRADPEWTHKMLEEDHRRHYDEERTSR